MKQLFQIYPPILFAFGLLLACESDIDDSMTDDYDDDGLDSTVVMGDRTVTIEQVNGPYSNSISAFCIDPDGNLFVANGGLLYRQYAQDGIWLLLQDYREIYSMLAIPNGAILVGSERGIELSNDQGDSWLVVSQVEGRVNSFLLLDEQTILAIVTYPGSNSTPTEFLKSSDNGVTWVQTTMGTAEVIIENLHQCNDDLYGIADKTVYVSSDQGASWVDLAASYTNPRNIKPRWVACDQQGTVVIAERYNVLRKGQDNWELIGTLPQEITHLAVDPNGKILVFTHEGVYQEDPELAFKKIHYNLYDKKINVAAFIQGKWYAGVEDQGLWITEDVYNRWHQIGTPMSLRAFGADQNGYLYALSDMEPKGLFSSRDRGFSWDLIYADGIRDFKIMDDKLLIMVDRNELLVSTNLGASWNTAGKPEGYLSHFYIEGANGKLYSTANNLIYEGTSDGSAWNLLVATDFSITSLHVLENNTLVAGSGYGVLKSDDLGQTWDSLFTIEAETYISINQSGEYLATVSKNGVVISDQQGENWKLVAITEGYNLNYPFTDHQNRIWIVGYNPEIGEFVTLVSLDGGHQFDYVTYDNFTNPFALYFSNNVKSSKVYAITGYEGLWEIVSVD